MKAKEIEVVTLFTAFIAATYGFGVYLFPAIVESVRQDIPFSYGTLGTVSGMVQAGFMISAIVAGPLTLRFGPMPLIFGSVFTCATCLAGLAISPDIYTTSVLLVLLGSCAVIVWVPMVEVSRDVLAPEHQGKALGLMSSGTSYGVFVNSVLMITILPDYGWRWMWGLTAAIVAALAFAALLRLRNVDAGKATKEPLHTEVKQEDSGRLRLFARPLTVALFVLMFMNGFSCMPFQTYLSAFLQGEAGLSESEAAAAWRLVGFVGMFSGFLVGWIADKITARLAMVMTYVVLSFACVAITIAPHAAGGILLTSSAVGFGTAFYAIFGLVPAYISQSFGKGDAALVFSFVNIGLGLGGVAGNLLGGFIKESSGTFVTAYLVMAGAALFSAVLSLCLPSERLDKLNLRRAGKAPNA